MYKGLTIASPFFEIGPKAFSYVKVTISGIIKNNPGIQFLQAAVISNGQDVYKVIMVGADAREPPVECMMAKNP